MEIRGYILKVLFVVYMLPKIVEMRYLFFDLNTCTYEYDKNFTANMSLVVDTINSHKVINGFIINAVNLDNFRILLTLNVPQKNGRNLTMFNLAVDGCDYAQESFGSNMNLASLAIRYIRESLQNMPTKCPVIKGTHVNISNLYFDSHKLPVYLPQTPFCFIFALKIRDRTAYTIYVTGAIREGGKKRG